MSKKARLMVVLSSINVFVKLLRTGDPFLFQKTYMYFFIHFTSNPSPYYKRSDLKTMSIGQCKMQTGVKCRLRVKCRQQTVDFLT